MQEDSEHALFVCGNHVVDHDLGILPSLDVVHRLDVTICGVESFDEEGIVCKLCHFREDLPIMDLDIRLDREELKELSKLLHDLLGDLLLELDSLCSMDESGDVGEIELLQELILVTIHFRVVVW